MNGRRLSIYDRSACFPVVERCYSWTWNDYHMTPHRHEMAEIMYLLRGRCRVQIEEAGRVHELDMRVGEFVFIDADVCHALHVDESCYMVNVEFAMTGEAAMLTLDALKRTSSVFRAWMDRKKPYQCGKDADGSLMGILAAVVEDHTHQSAVDPALKEMRLGQLMIQMSDALMTSGANAGGIVHVRRCVKLLSERLDEDIRVDDIAAELGLSTAYLQRIFRQVQGKTIIAYLNQLRIERAKLLLTNTKDAVVDIAIASGFNSRQHFARVFSDLVGCSPTEFRSRPVAREVRMGYGQES